MKTSLGYYYALSQEEISNFHVFIDPSFYLFPKKIFSDFKKHSEHNLMGKYKEREFISLLEKELLRISQFSTKRLFASSLSEKFVLERESAKNEFLEKISKEPSFKFSQSMLLDISSSYTDFLSFLDSLSHYKKKPTHDFCAKQCKSYLDYLASQSLLSSTYLSAEQLSTYSSILHYNARVFNSSSKNRLNPLLLSLNPKPQISKVMNSHELFGEKPLFTHQLVSIYPSFRSS